MRITFLDRYTTTAAAGYDSENAGQIVVAELPPGAMVPGGNVRIPMTIGSDTAGWIDTICTGWTDDPEPTLYIHYGGASLSGSLTVTCAPNAATNEAMVRQVDQFTDPYGNYFAPLMGAKNYIYVADYLTTGAFEVALTTEADATPFDDGGTTTQISVGQQATRLLMKKATPGAVTLTWSGATIYWADGEAQFQSGKSRLWIELEYIAADNVYLGRWTAHT